jgi:uncharacterized membrane protein
MTSATHLRQLVDRIRHRLLFVPLSFVVGAVAFAQAMLWVDAQLGEDALPTSLETTADGGRAVLSTIAGGLIASVTLLLSLMLVAVQLGNTQFSPRTLRDWIGNRTQQLTIGVVLGTTVYCLLALRRTRIVDEGTGALPHLTVLLAVGLGVLALVMVVRSVDHLADSLRIGSVAGRLKRETIELVRSKNRVSAYGRPAATPAPDIESAASGSPRDGRARPIESNESGWVQQIDEEALVEALPDGAGCHVAAGLGVYVSAGMPLAWVTGVTDELEAEVCDAVRAAVAIGDTRTMQQDVGFGVLQMVDIALRALSPGVNDPSTANDIIVHLGEVMIAVWELPAGGRRRQLDHRELVTPDLDHAGHLHAAFDQIRRHGAEDMDVATTMVRTLFAIRQEAIRRRLEGPIDPIDEMLDLVLAGVEASNALEADKASVRELFNQRQ